MLIPVVGELDQGRAARLGAIEVAGRRQENQRVAPLLVVAAAGFDEAQLVAVEVERLVEVRDPNHRVQIFHASLLCPRPYIGQGSANEKGRILDQPTNIALRDSGPVAKRKERAALWSILASVAITIAKGLAGLATGSLALISDAAHSLLDV